MHAERRLFAGIDGGQTSTVAVVANAAADVLGRGTAGPCDHIDEPPTSRRCAEACESAVAAALAAAGLPPATPLEAVTIGLSGYDGDFHGVEPRFGNARITYAHDAPVALAAASERRPAVVVIAGTGSVAYGEDGLGRALRVGGYGYLFGDAGSSFWLARSALARAMEGADAGRTTRLGDAALAYFDRPDLRALARAYYVREIDRPALAGFARVVLDAARLGDAEAIELGEAAAVALAILAANAIERLELQHTTVPVALTGGLFASSDLFARTAERIGTVAPNAWVIRPAHDPAVGAVRLAVASA